MSDNMPVVRFERPDENSTKGDLRIAFARELADLLQAAQNAGFVMTVELEPLQPLAMRNYRMVGHVRDER